MIFDQLDKNTCDQPTQALIDHWERLPRTASTLCPSRKDVSLPMLSSIIPQTYISEFISTTHVRVLTSGARLSKYLGANISGKNIFELLPPSVRQKEEAYYTALQSTPCVGVLTRSALNIAKDPVLYQTIQLPLCDNEGKVRFFIGTGQLLKRNDLPADAPGLNFNTLAFSNHRYIDIGAGIPS